MKFFIEPYPHQLDILEMSKRHRELLLLWEMGCLVGDTKVRVSYMGNSKEITLAKLYDQFRSPDRNKFAFKARSYKGTGLGLNQILDVQCTGTKDVYTITLEDGRTLTGTSDHKLLGPSGWMELGRTPGEEVYVEAEKIRVSKKRYRTRRVGPHHPFAQKNTITRKDRNNKKVTYFVIEVHRIAYEAHINKLPVDKYLQKVRKGDTEGMLFIDPLVHHIHHKDRVHTNNDPSNLQLMTKKEHHQLHMREDTYTNMSFKPMKVLHIEFAGERKTYDIAMRDPYNSYIANGIVVHNTGKTMATINMMRLQYGRHHRILRTLILTPLVTIYNWKKEILRFSKIKKHNVLVVDKTGKKRYAMVEKQIEKYPESIIIMNYEALQNKEFFEMLQKWNPEMVIADEIHLIKNHKSKRAILATKLADEARFKYGLTGTPILNKIQDIYMQYRFIDGGRRFGRNFFIFRDIYMIDANASWSKKQQYFPKWEPRPEKFGELSEKMFQIATRVTKQDCLKDLPPLIKIRRDIPMGKDQAKAYLEMSRDFITFVENKRSQGEKEAVVAQLALTKALRLMQICSGFVTTEDGTEVEFDKIPKMDDLKEVLETVTPNHKIIVWCCFKKNYEMIGDLCEKLKIEHRFITGKMSIRDKQKAMEDFRTREDVRVIIANRRAGGIGVNLVEASYSYVYSRNFSYGEEKQSEARNHRSGSQIHDKIIKFDACCVGSIEVDTLAALQDKQEMSSSIIDAVKEKVNV